MRKKKVAVLHAQVPFVRGGAELLTENLAKQLRRRGFDAELVSIPFKWYPANTLLDSYLMWRMVDLSESNGQKIDLLIALKTPTYLARHPNKVLWLMHQHRAAYDLRDNKMAGGFNTIPGGREIGKIIRHMDNLTIPEAKSIYTISKTVTSRLQQFNQISSTPLYHPPALAGQYHSGDFGDYILSVGRLDPNKRIDLLIQALCHCDKKIRVKIAGKGNEMKTLQQLAHRLGVEDRVDFLGFVPDDDLPDLYANALAVCFPPIGEDYGYITLEAFLSQKPLLTCWDSGGVLEFAVHEENALIVDFDAEKMGHCFNRVFQNKDKAREMGRLGYDRVKDINWDYVIDELTKTIR